MKLLRVLFDVLFPPRPFQQIVETLISSTLLRLYRIRHIKGLGITYLLPYGDERVRACIQEAKFFRNEQAITLLAHILEKHMQRMVQVPILVPIPLSKERRRSRGYNQVEEVLNKTSFSYSKLLIRTRNTPPQTQLDKKARKGNMNDAFICTQTLSPNHIYVLLDDVATTGATLCNGARALEKAGARQIRLLSLAH